MVATDHTQFQHIQHIGNDYVSNKVITNLIHWMSWSFLGIGGFFNRQLDNSSGAYGTSDWTKLRLAEDSAYTANTVYETPRYPLAYESNISYKDGQPIQISGVYVDDVFYKPNDTSFGHTVQYPTGRVIFNNPISSSSVVRMEYSDHWINIQKSDAPFFRELMYGSFRIEDTHFTTAGSGSWSVGAHHRIILPAVILEGPVNFSAEPYELGNSTARVRQNYLAHVLTEDSWSKQQISDILVNQVFKQIKLYNTVEVSGDYPLNFDGSKNTGTSANYPNLVDPTGYEWGYLRIMDASISEVESFSPRLFESVVTWDCEVLNSNA